MTTVEIKYLTQPHDGTPGTPWDDFEERIISVAAGKTDDRGWSLADTLNGVAARLVRPFRAALLEQKQQPADDDLSRSRCCECGVYWSLWYCVGVYIDVYQHGIPLVSHTGAKPDSVPRLSSR